MAKITYLLGAGASAGSLPTVDGFKTALPKIIEDLNRFGVSFADKFSNKKIQIENIQRTLRDLSKLYQGCIEHRSVDTYTKRLFLTAKTRKDEINYHIAKCSIILFFDLYRFFTNSIDRRYDAFLATVLSKNDEGKLVLPNDINILSWNYDYEFERAYMRYATERNSIDEVYEDLNIVHKNSPEERSISENFGILKINGTAGFFHKGKIILGVGHWNLVHKVEVISHMNVIDKNIDNLMLLIDNYQKFSRTANQYKPAISFAWESGDGLEKIKTEISRVLSNTEKLIIVGYSFPYFNREIDKYIMDCLGDLPHLEIYVQDVPERANELIDNIKELRRFSVVTENAKGRLEHKVLTKFTPKTDLTQFYMSF